MRKPGFGRPDLQASSLLSSIVLTTLGSSTVLCELVESSKFSLREPAKVATAIVLVALRSLAVLLSTRSSAVVLAALTALAVLLGVAERETGFGCRETPGHRDEEPQESQDDLHVDSKFSAEKCRSCTEHLASREPNL